LVSYGLSALQNYIVVVKALAIANPEPHFIS